MKWQHPEEVATMLRTKKEELVGEALKVYLREGSWVKRGNYPNLSEIWSTIY